jgi:hypothetical protein
MHLLLPTTPTTTCREPRLGTEGGHSAGPGALSPDEAIRKELFLTAMGAPNRINGVGRVGDASSFLAHGPKRFLRRHELNPPSTTVCIPSSHLARSEHVQAQSTPYCVPVSPRRPHIPPPRYNCTHSLRSVRAAPVGSHRSNKDKSL